ncbi:hypothetical protein P3102_22180 [Amycolatopsis sp. QT-25]|uniref:hypothetical protein n=1 Tax=Amycolatopsis sp. QT-25 TaxID=3034022 RepID=UPI0023ED910E|nr:hypothetical protein [Amycolatopsis sp. QT-25]WET76816.1 hypothetical protein P3102_22180 [Amycolatopsis sp. QT-25]
MSTVPEEPALETGLELLDEPTLARVVTHGHRAPRSGWLGVGALIAESLSLRDHRIPATATVAFGSGTRSEGPQWTSDVPVPAGGFAVLAGRTDDGHSTWTAYLADDLVTAPVALTPAMDVWGGHLLLVRDGARPLATVVDTVVVRPGLLSLPPGLLAIAAAGAHALGVAARFRDAFLRKAARSARGWAAVKTIDDPMVLSILLTAEELLDGAAALLNARVRALIGDPDPGPGAWARLVLAGIGALDAACAATTKVMTVTGASALYDGNPMQESFAHLAALSAHPLFDRPVRLLNQRAALEPDLDRLFTDDSGEAR